jgi:hypothetical protein
MNLKALKIFSFSWLNLNFVAFSLLVEKWRNFAESIALSVLKKNCVKSMAEVS